MAFHFRMGERGPPEGIILSSFVVHPVPTVGDDLAIER